MSADEKSELIAEYQILQGAITAASQVIIQVLGFSIAAIVALMVASLNTKNIYPFWGVIFVILSSELYVAAQSKLIVDTETYIVVFVESNLSSFRWKQRLFNKHKNLQNQKQVFARPFIFSDLVAILYIIILIFSLTILFYNRFKPIFFPNDELSYILLFSNFAIFVLVVYNLAPYSTIKYYSKSKDEWQKMKEQEELGKLEQLMIQKPPQAKLVESSGKEFPIPESAYPVLHQVIQLMASGEAVSVVPQKREVTTREAAELLNVPRPYLIKLLEEGKIPYTKVGLHRYIRYEDVMAYKKQRDTQRREGLRELTQFLQDEGFYE